MHRLALTAILVVAGLVLAAVAAAVWRHQETPGDDLFAATAGVSGAGALVVGVAVAAALPRQVVLATTVIVALLFPVSWFLFALAYTGRNEFRSTGIVVAIATIPAAGLVATAVVFGAQLLPGVQLPAQTAADGAVAVAVAVAIIGFLQTIALLYAGGLTMVGSGVVLWTFHRYEHLDDATGTALGVFGTVPWLSLFLGFQVAGVDTLALPTLVGAGFLVGGVAAVAGLRRYHLFESSPAAGNVGSAAVVAELGDVVVVTDATGTVVEINAAAEEALGTTAPEVVGGGVKALLGVEIAELRAASPVELRSAVGRRLFEPTVSELTTQHGRRLGYAVSLRDVTDRRTRQQRLTVLNRVLRHNLRNDMTVIMGGAESIQSETPDPDIADQAGRIVKSSQRLIDLVAEAREVDQLLSTVEARAGQVSLASLVDRVLAGVDANADVGAPAASRRISSWKTPPSGFSNWP